MIDLDKPMRTIACAAKLRDWATIDRVLEDQRLRGKMAVILGFTDARRELGTEARHELASPDPVTIHDLPSREGIEICRGFADTWRRKAA